MKIIITENQLSLIVQEQGSMGGFMTTDGTAYVDLGKKLAKNSFDDFVEGIREFMGGTEGVIIQTILDVIPGAGKLINMSAWSLLGLYDIMKGLTKGAWNWFNILVDIAGIILSGPGATYVKKILGSIASKGTGKLSDFIALMSKKVPQAYSYISGLVKSFGSVISKVSSAFNKFITWAAKHFKGTSIYKSLLNMKSTITSGLSKVLGWLENAISQKGVSSVKNVVKKTAHTSKHAAQHKVQHDTVHAGIAGVTGGGGGHH
jgi:hypothetical protein